MKEKAIIFLVSLNTNNGDALIETPLRNRSVTIFVLILRTLVDGQALPMLAPSMNHT